MHFNEKLVDFGAKMVFLLVLPGMALVAFTAGGVDFRSYYAAAQLALEGGNPYDYQQLAPVLVEITGFAGNAPFFYPPWFLIFITPLTMLPFQAARLVWLVLNAGLFFASLEIVRSLLGWRVSGWRKWGAYLLALLMFGAYCLRSEQLGIVLLFSLALCLWALQRQKYALAGLSLVLLLTKPQSTGLAAAVLFLWMLKNQRRSLAAAAGWTAALTLAGTILIPGWWRFDRHGFGRGLAQELDGPGQVVAERVLTTGYDFFGYGLGIEAPLSYLLVAILGAAGIVIVVRIWRLGGTPALTSSASLILTLFITPYTLQYDYVPLVLPFFWILMQFNEMRSAAKLLAILSLVVAFSVPLWQHWSYQGYLQLLAVAAAFALVLVDLTGRPAPRQRRLAPELLKGP